MKDFMEAIRLTGNSMPGGFFVYLDDECEELIYCNDVTLDIFGCKDEEEFKKLTGGTFKGLVHPDDLGSVEEQIKKQINENSNDKNLDYVEYRIVRKDGSIRWVDDYGRHIQTEEFGDVYFVLIRDITDTKKALEEKKSAEIELERQKHLNDVRKDFLFQVSHDIRTPMNAIKGFTDLALLNMDDKDALKEYLGKVDLSNKQMLGLIDDLLEMSLLDSGKIVVDHLPCTVCAIINEVKESYEEEANKKGITIVLDNQAKCIPVFADEVHIKRVLRSILSNAIKFTGEGGNITLRVKQENDRDGYSDYIFEIIDTGIGMDAGFMANVFDPFSKEATATASGQGGAGLGLAVAARLVDAMGGSIAAESKKGEGSKFTVTLTLKRNESDREEDAALKNDKRRILLVEDVDVNRMLAENILTMSGFEVESVVDGNFAVDAVRDKPAGYYDLILMDIQMPVMDGYEATRQIRALKKSDSASIPIIALSANARKEDKRMSIESGMNSHVAKPFDIDNLVATINAYIR